MWGWFLFFLKGGGRHCISVLRAGRGLVEKCGWFDGLLHMYRHLRVLEALCGSEDVDGFKWYIE